MPGGTPPPITPKKQATGDPPKPVADTPPPAPPRIGLRSDSASYFCIGPTVAPGILRSGGIKIKRALDVAKSKGAGTKATTSTTNGEKPVDVTITLTFWDGDRAGADDAPGAHLENEEGRLYTLIGMLFPDGDKAPTPFDCFHPKLTLHRLRSLFFEAIDGPDDVEPGVWSYTLKAANWRPPEAAPKNATSTPGASKSGTGTDPHGSSVSDLRDEEKAAELAKRRAAWILAYNARKNWLRDHNTPQKKALAAAVGDYGPPDPGEPPGGWPKGATPL